MRMVAQPPLGVPLHTDAEPPAIGERDRLDRLVVGPRLDDQTRAQPIHRLRVQ